MALLRESSENLGEALNLGSIKNEDDDGLVRHGDLLTRFTTAVLGDENEELNDVRRGLYVTLGEAALVDAAGCVASFNAAVIGRPQAGPPAIDVAGTVDAMM